MTLVCCLWQHIHSESLKYAVLDISWGQLKIILSSKHLMNCILYTNCVYFFSVIISQWLWSSMFDPQNHQPLLYRITTTLMRSNELLLFLHHSPLDSRVITTVLRTGLNQSRSVNLISSKIPWRVETPSLTSCIKPGDAYAGPTGDGRPIFRPAPFHPKHFVQSLSSNHNLT